MDEELYKWYPIVDEGEYWTDWDISPWNEKGAKDKLKIVTIVTDGSCIYSNEECKLGWGTMAKQGCWKYMRIKLD